MIRIQDPDRNNQNFFSPYEPRKQMTRPTALWRNHVQEEICRFIEAQNFQLAPTHQLASALNHLHETADTVHEGNVREAFLLDVPIKPGSKVSFVLSLDLDTTLAESPLDPTKVKPLFSVFASPLPSLRDNIQIKPMPEAVQEIISTLYLKVHRPIFRVCIDFSETGVEVHFEHGIMTSASIAARTNEIDDSLYPIKQLYDDHQGLNEQTSTYPIFFALTSEGKLGGYFNEPIFGPHIQGSVRVFDLRISE
jgi:hypothetical protein